MVFKAVQLVKIEFPRVVTPVRVTLARFSQLAKALSPKAVMLLVNVTLVKLLQYAKAFSPMWVTVERLMVCIGVLIKALSPIVARLEEVNEVIPEFSNAFAPIVVALLSFKVDNNVQPQKARSPIVTAAGIEIVVKEEQSLNAFVSMLVTPEPETEVRLVQPSKAPSPIVAVSLLKLTLVISVFPLNADAAILATQPPSK